MAVAGYVFSDTQAGRFTREWAKTLPKLGISFARMTDCATGNGEYKNLTMEARIASEKALIAQIRNRAAVGIAVAVDPTKYQAALAHDKFALTPYTFCLSMCVTGANRWALENGVKELAFFFESGHADQSQANDLMNRISKNIPPQSRTYVSHTFADKKLVQPLQAADML